MLRKFRRKRARVPLTLVKGKRISLLHADGGFSVDEVCGLASFQRCVGYRAFQSWLCLLASRISPAMFLVSFLNYDWGRCGLTSYLSPKAVKLKKSPSDSRDTDGDLVKDLLGMSLKIHQ